MVQWYIYAIGASLFTALASIFQKKTLQKERSLEFSAVLSLFTIVLTLPLIFKIEIIYNPKTYILLFIASMCAATAYLLVAKAVKHMNISEAAPFLTFQPALVAVLAFFVLGEDLARNQIFGILILMAGSYVLEADHTIKNIVMPLKKIWKSKYIHFIFMALLLWSFSGIIERYLLAEKLINPITIVFIAQIFVAINFMILLKAFHGGFKNLKHGIKNAGGLILLVALMTVSYRLLQAQAMALAFYSLVNPIKRTSSLFVTIIGGELFHEKGIFLKSLACVVMLCGAYLIIMG